MKECGVLDICEEAEASITGKCPIGETIAVGINEEKVEVLNDSNGTILGFLVNVGLNELTSIEVFPFTPV